MEFFFTIAFSIIIGGWGFLIAGAILELAIEEEKNKQYFLDLDKE